MNIKSLLKKAAIGLGLVATVASAQTTTPLPRFLPLLSGYNVLVLSNAVPAIGTVTGVGLGTTNVLYTAYNGQILYSLTNNSINATLNTNFVAKDAFQTVDISPDNNGDINANASVWIMIGNTNLIPIAITNSVGQWFVPSLPNTTNYATAAWATAWPLAPSTGPSWMSPATTNTYPLFDPKSTNTIVVTLYRAPTLKLSGGLGSDLSPAVPMWETSSAFSFAVTQTGLNTVVCVSTNLPIGWLQGARHVYATVQLPPNLSTNLPTSGVLVNQLGILQPQP